MTGGVVFGLLWAAVGIVLGIRWRDERARWRTTAAVPAVATPRARFGADTQDGSIRRTAAMFLAYASGALIISVGVLTSTAVLLGVGAGLVNLGTVFRFLVLALDRAHLESPVIPSRAPRHRGRPAVSGFLDLAN
jgi:hypothetical protein